MLILSFPPVQTALGKYATNKINKEFGTNINIGKVGLQFNGDVELKEIYIEDYKKVRATIRQRLFKPTDYAELTINFNETDSVDQFYVQLIEKQPAANKVDFTI